MTSQMREESIKCSVQVKREGKSQKGGGKLTKSLVCKINKEPNRHMHILTSQIFCGQAIQTCN